MKVKTKEYLHSCKDSNADSILELGKEHGVEISDEALYKFKSALYEVEFDLEVDLETGEYTVLGMKDL